MQNQMYPCLNQIFSKYHCGFRKGYTAQHCSMEIIEKWRKFFDIGGHGGALLIDLSKAFNCVDHELLIAKLHAYGFNTDALKCIYSYLKRRKRGLREIFHIVPLLKFCLVYLKDQFLGHYYLTRTYVIFSTKLMI